MVLCEMKNGLGEEPCGCCSRGCANFPAAHKNHMRLLDRDITRTRMTTKEGYLLCPEWVSALAGILERISSSSRRHPREGTVIPQAIVPLRLPNHRPSWYSWVSIHSICHFESWDFAPWMDVSCQIDGGRDWMVSHSTVSYGGSNVMRVGFTPFLDNTGPEIAAVHC